MAQPDTIDIALKHTHCSVDESDDEYRVVGHPLQGPHYWERNPATVHWDVVNEIGTGGKPVDPTTGLKFITRHGFTGPTGVSPSRVFSLHNFNEIVRSTLISEPFVTSKLGATPTGAYAVDYLLGETSSGDDILFSAVFPGVTNTQIDEDFNNRIFNGYNIGTLRQAVNFDSLNNNLPIDFFFDSDAPGFVGTGVIVTVLKNDRSTSVAVTTKQIFDAIKTKLDALVGLDNPNTVWNILLGSDRVSRSSQVPIWHSTKHGIATMATAKLEMDRSELYFRWVGVAGAAVSREFQLGAVDVIVTIGFDGKIGVHNFSLINHTWEMVMSTDSYLQDPFGQFPGASLAFKSDAGSQGHHSHAYHILIDVGRVGGGTNMPYWTLGRGSNIKSWDKPVDATRQVRANPITPTIKVSADRVVVHGEFHVFRNLLGQDGINEGVSVPTTFAVPSDIPTRLVRDFIDSRYRYAAIDMFRGSVNEFYWWTPGFIPVLPKIDTGQEYDLFALGIAIAPAIALTARALTIDNDATKTSFFLKFMNSMAEPDEFNFTTQTGWQKTRNAETFTNGMILVTALIPGVTVIRPEGYDPAEFELRLAFSNGTLVPKAEYEDFTALGFGLEDVTGIINKADFPSGSPYKTHTLKYVFMVSKTIDSSALGKPWHPEVYFVTEFYNEKGEHLNYIINKRFTSDNYARGLLNPNRINKFLFVHSEQRWVELVTTLGGTVLIIPWPRGDAWPNNTGKKIIPSKVEGEEDIEVDRADYGRVLIADMLSTTLVATIQVPNVSPEYILTVFTPAEIGFTPTFVGGELVSKPQRFLNNAPDQATIKC